MAATPVRAAILVHVGGKHPRDITARMCIFVKGRICPVPEDEADPEYCVACSEWASVLLQRQNIETQKEMLAVMKLEGLYDLAEDDKKKRDEEWWYA